MNPLVDAAVEAARHAISKTRAPAKLPATVTAVSAKTATVLVDGTTTAVPVTDLVGTSVNKRVLVEFRPDGAAYIVNTIV